MKISEIVYIILVVFTRIYLLKVNIFFYFQPVKVMLCEDIETY